MKTFARWLRRNMPESPCCYSGLAQPLMIYQSMEIDALLSPVAERR